MLNDAITAELDCISESISRHVGLDMVSEMTDVDFVVKPERPSIMLSLLQRSAKYATGNENNERYDTLAELRTEPKDPEPLPELPWESTAVESGGLRMRYPLHSQEWVDTGRGPPEPWEEGSATDLDEDVWHRTELSYLSVPAFSSPPPLPLPILPPATVEPAIEVPPLSKSELRLHREAEEVARILKEREGFASVTPIGIS
ncbi:hypothetical protein RvY_15364 [Ramazzottius varieornatus]|uniref:Uncharacterized protein n=1 Tax=Ramazzottius varieornatus TaxID=947166 RepID=A0A1D1VWA2_RAMVA|nr:hypothetical protein RvY_15364 [Ramazzottius varieornatus]